MRKGVLQKSSIHEKASYAVIEICIQLLVVVTIHPQHRVTANQSANDMAMDTLQSQREHHNQYRLNPYCVVPYLVHVYWFGHHPC